MDNNFKNVRAGNNQIKNMKVVMLVKISIEHTRVCIYVSLNGNKQNFLSFAVEVQRLFQIMFNFFPIYVQVLH